MKRKGDPVVECIAKQLINFPRYVVATSDWPPSFRKRHRVINEYERFAGERHYGEFQLADELGANLRAHELNARYITRALRRAGHIRSAKP